MASFTGVFLLTYLLSASFTDEVQLNITPIQKIVDYQYNLGFSELIPGKLYNGSIRANFAVPQSSLCGLDGQSVAVKVTAETDSNSSVFFPGLSGTESKSAEAYLRCDVSNCSCANTSNLFSDIPVFAYAKEGQHSEASIRLKSEITDAPPSIQLDLQGAASSFIESFKNILNPNSSQNSSQEPSPLELLNQGGNSTSPENILDGLKPEGDGSDPVEFLRKNSFVSIGALLIVIIITGAYLLNAKD